MYVCSCILFMRVAGGIPLGQALEQCYNWPLKVSGGIIARSFQEEGLPLWGSICGPLKKNKIQEELSLHHSFNPSTATTIVGMA